MIPLKARKLTGSKDVLKANNEWGVANSELRVADNE